MKKLSLFMRVLAFFTLCAFLAFWLSLAFAAVVAAGRWQCECRYEIAEVLVMSLIVSVSGVWLIRVALATERGFSRSARRRWLITPFGFYFSSLWQILSGRRPPAP